jgi:CBS domain-containing protein
MKISAIMTPAAAVAGPNDSLQRAAQLMSRVSAGALPVCDADRLAGVIADRDIVVHAVAKGNSPNEITVSDVVTGATRFACEDEVVIEVADTRHNGKSINLPLLNRDGMLVGIIALGDAAIIAAALRGQSIWN